MIRRLVVLAALAALVVGAPTASATDSKATLVAAGDIASCTSTGDTATARLVRGITGTVATLGDSVYRSGTPAEFAACYGPTWGAFRARTRPAPGNHDYATKGAAGYFGYFGARAGSRSRGYYAYELGTWRIYALNSNCWAVGGCGVGSAQERWLRADLAAHPHTCIGAYWHHPLFSSGLHGDNRAVAPLYAALDKAGAEWVLAGHDHDYERFAPLRADGTEAADGIVSFVVGTGGASRYRFGTRKPGSVARTNANYGVLVLTLREGSYDFRFATAGTSSFADAGSAACH